MIGRYYYEGKCVGTVSVPLLVGRSSYGAMAPVFVTVVGPRRIVQAAWKGIVSGSGWLDVTARMDGEDRGYHVSGNYDTRLATFPMQNLDGNVSAVTVYDRRILMPWTCGSGKVFGFGETLEQARQRFFDVMDRLTDIPLAREWRDLLWEKFAMEDGEDAVVLGHPEHTRHFAYARLHSFDDDKIKNWLDELFPGSAQSTGCAA